MPIAHKHDWNLVGSFPDRYTRTAYYKCACGKIEKRTEWWVDLQPKTIGSQGGASVCAPVTERELRTKGGPAVHNLRGHGPTDLAVNNKERKTQ